LQFGTDKETRRSCVNEGDRQTDPRERRKLHPFQYYKYHKYHFCYLARGTEVQSVHQYGTWVHHHISLPIPIIPPQPSLPHPSLFEIIHKKITILYRNPKSKYKDKYKYPKHHIPPALLSRVSIALLALLPVLVLLTFSAADTRRRKGRQTETTTLLYTQETHGQFKKNERSSHSALQLQPPRFRHN
jgi:hypothetical protein